MNTAFRLQLLDRMLAGAKRMPGTERQIYLATCTPDIASLILANSNNDNRKLRPKKVEGIVASILNGAWRLKGTIEFLTNGTLLDGQHRLAACASACRSLEFLCLVTPESEASESNKVTDTGQPRTLPDWLKFNGVIPPNRWANALRTERGHRIGTGGWGTPQGSNDDYLALYQEVQEPMKRGFEIVPSGMASTLRVHQSTLDWFAYHTTRINGPAAKEFMELLDAPIGVAADHPARVLHKRLVDAPRNKKKVSREHAVLLVKAWNAYYAGETVESHQQYRPTSPIPPFAGR